LTPPAPGDRPSVQTLTDLPLMPIGRIATSGPDTAPKRYSDQGLGATWFTAGSSDATSPAAAKTEATTPAATEPAASSGELPKPTSGAGLVIDLDLTGILNGTNTGEQPVVVSRAPDESGQSLPTRRSKKPAAGPEAPLGQQATTGQQAPTGQQAHTGQQAPTGQHASAAPQATNGTQAADGLKAEAAPEATGGQQATTGQHASVGQHASADQHASAAPQATNGTQAADGLEATNGPQAATGPRAPKGQQVAPAPMRAPAMPAEGTAAGRAGTAGQEWAARDDAKKPRPAEEPVEVQTPVRPLRPLAADDLAAIRWRLDGGTLREVVDDRDALRELGARLDGPLAAEADNVTRSGLLSVRAEVYRLLDELGLAAAASRLALAHAESSGDTQSMVIAQAELAHVLRLRGDFAEADRLFEEAAGSEAADQLRSVVHENAGRSCFDQGRHMEALDHFARAVRLGSPEDTDLVERIDVSLEAVYIHALRDGWGPYPRLRREILGRNR
jgi:tetratricopeptide (TPR) repeat protein